MPSFEDCRLGAAAGMLIIRFLRGVVGALIIVSYSM
jgi:hypothetical protein